MTIDEQSAWAITSWQRFNREITDDLARAVVSAFALVAVADGDLAEAEIDSFVQLIHRREDILSALNFERYEPLFRDICGAILSDPEAGRTSALQLISALKADPEHSELVLSAAQIALMADNREQASEKQILESIRTALDSA